MIKCVSDKYVSVIVPTLKGGANLKRFFESLKKCGVLSASKYEVIVVDNSQDNLSEKNIKSTCSLYGAVYVREKRAGKPYAVNAGIEKSKGKYVVFTDDDVVIKDKMWLEKFAQEFEKNPNLGYCSGNVISLKNEYEAEKIWESNGGLSKGGKVKLWNADFFDKFKYKIFPWLFHRICAGANSAMPRSVLDKIGKFNTFLSNIGHGDTLEIGYRVAKAGFEMKYAPSISLYHLHPEKPERLMKKMRLYGKGDTAYPMLIFLEHGDVRYLWWSLLGHPVHTLKKFVLRGLGRYNLPARYILESFLGSMSGGFLCVFFYVRTQINK